MKYYKLNKTKQDTDKVNTYFWELIRPLAIRDPEDVTNYLYSIIKHPQREEYAFEVPEVLTVEEKDFNGNLTGEMLEIEEAEFSRIPIHAQTTDANIDERTQDLENKGVLTAQEKQALRTAVKANKGKKVKGTDLFPARYKGFTREEMEADGWLILNNNLI